VTNAVAEHDMLDPVRRLFPASRYRRQTEVALASKMIDLCVFPKDSDELPIAVELKVEKWRRALWQAMTYRQVFAFAYVAIWHEHLHRVDRDLLRAAGVGLIVSTRSKATLVMQAVRSPHYSMERVRSLLGWPPGRGQQR
jgi:hypothetical protein